MNDLEYSQSLNKKLLRELGEAEELLRRAWQNHDRDPTLYDDIEAFLNRGW